MTEAEQRAGHVPGMTEQFREAIVESRAALSDFPGLADFPQGPCGDASILLGEYLYDRGHGEWRYVSGQRSADDYTHAWLEDGGLIVDITADQFPDVDEAVIVTTDRGWHRQFQPDRDEALPARISMYDHDTVEMLRAAYEVILMQLNPGGVAAAVTRRAGPAEPNMPSARAGRRGATL